MAARRPGAPGELDSLCEWMAESLCMAILGERRFYLTEPLKELRAVQGVMFSGRGR